MLMMIDESNDDDWLDRIQHVMCQDDEVIKKTITMKIFFDNNRSSIIEIEIEQYLNV